MYELDDMIDTYAVRLRLWDASLEVASAMVQANKAGWDAVVICSDVMDPATMQEPLKWVSGAPLPPNTFHSPLIPVHFGAMY